MATKIIGLLTRSIILIMERNAQPSFKRNKVKLPPIQFNSMKKDILTKQQVKSMIKSMQPPAEIKWKDTDLNSSGVTSAGIVTLLSGISQNATANGRVGNVVNLDRLEFRFSTTVASADVTNGVRLIIFQWCSEQTVPSLGDVLENTGSAIVTTSQFNGDHTNSNTLRIMFDKLYPLNINGMAQSVLSIVLNPIKRKLVYETSTASLGNGEIYCAIVSDSNVSANPSFQYDARLYYSDS